MPSLASPAAKVTACCSAMPNRSNASEAIVEFVEPVPEAIAAVIATMALVGFGLGDQCLGKDIGVARRGGFGFDLRAVATSI